MVNIISKAQVDNISNQSFGDLRINVLNNSNIPVNNARISVSYSGVPESTFESLQTNISGRTDTISLPAPPIEYSLDSKNIIQPYSEYTITVTAPDYEPINVSGIEILPDTISESDITLIPSSIRETPDNVAIPPHTLYGEYPPKIAEDEIKPMDESGEIVLNRVVIPEYVVVHDGAPTDPTANDYYVLYSDYIKNVASSEIYATWPESTIYANILAIMSFTLNRVYTEWYRGQGYNFTITSSTAYDHKWIYGRNIFDSISDTVDSIFNNYLSRPNVRQPILTQYCDGNRVFCPDWLSQWGSKYLGDDGYSAIEIIRNYYGDNMYINSAEQIAGVPSSWPGYNLDIGSSGNSVRQVQEQLDRIAEVYTLIPRIAADGTFGEGTQTAVRTFQQIFNMPATGIIDFPTWYKISQIYVGIARLSENI